MSLILCFCATIEVHQLFKDNAMAKQRKSFACPGCQKPVKVPVEHLGRRVKCPKCDFVFRAGPKSLQEPEVVYAELDDDLPDFDSLMPADTQYAPPLATAVSPPSLPPLPPTSPLGTTVQQSLPAYQSPRAVLPKSVQKKSTVEMTEKDSQIQSTGFFLISVPLIATVLPLFGLQLRRLARLGEFAPLAAMFLGFIGVGCICYARRNQRDQLIYGSSAAAFVLFVGIGGFILISAMGNFDKPNSGYEFQQQQQADFDRQIQRNIKRSQQAFEQRENQRKISSENRNSRLTEEMNQRFRETNELRDQMIERMNRQREEMSERARQQLRNMQDRSNPFAGQEDADEENPFIESDG